MNGSSESLAHALATDPVAQANVLRQLRDATLSGNEIATKPRELISQSWERSLSANVDPEADGPPVIFNDDDIRGVRDDHPLAECMPLLRQTLLVVAEEALHIMIVTDADGHILWREGCNSVQHVADQVGLSPGTRWAEEAIGTNAMGTTLAVNRPVQVHSAEHLVHNYHTWTCAAAPLHDPTTGALIGAIDISGPMHTIHPSTVALVSAAARLAEAHLATVGERREQTFRDRHWGELRQLRGQPGALISLQGKVLVAQSAGLLPSHIDTSQLEVFLPDGRQGRLQPLEDGYLLRLPTPRSSRQHRIHLRFQGESPPLVSVNGRTSSIALRHAEILAVLALHPRGLNAEQMAIRLYGDRGNPTTVRAEVHRLRTEFGRTILAGKPYRLNAEVTSDFHQLDEALTDGDTNQAADLYSGPLLPYSDSPAIRQEREELIAGIRQRALNAPSPEALWKYAQCEPGNGDAEVWQTLVTRLGPADPRLHRAQTRLAALVEE